MKDAVVVVVVTDYRHRSLWCPFGALLSVIIIKIDIHFPILKENDI